MWHIRLRPEISSPLCRWQSSRLVNSFHVVLVVFISASIVLLHVSRGRPRFLLPLSGVHLSSCDAIPVFPDNMSKPSPPPLLYYCDDGPLTYLFSDMKCGNLIVSDCLFGCPSSILHHTVVLTRRCYYRSLSCSFFSDVTRPDVMRAEHGFLESICNVLLVWPTILAKPVQNLLNNRAIVVQVLNTTSCRRR